MAGSFRGTGQFGGWALGATPDRLPGGLAWPLPAGSDLVLQTHFHPSGKAVKEKLTVGLYFAPRPPAHTLVNVQLPPAFGLFANIDIPPGKADYTVTDSFTLPVDVDLVSVSGHAHYLGKSLRSWAVLPDGKAQRLFFIKDWDFNWQGAYSYKQPLRLPRGTVLHVELIWDNSASNVRNPNQPPRRVKWGESTTAEMGSLRFLMVAAREKETSVLQSAYQEHFRRAVRTAVRRGDKIDLKQFGIELKPGALPGAKPALPARMPATASAVSVSDLEGNKVQPLQVGAAKATVLFFLAPDCPISNIYAPEINALVKEHADRSVRFWIVYVDPDLTVKEASKHAASFGYRCPVLLDPRHELVAATGVTITPEVAVVTADAQVAYHGRIDDRYPRIGLRRQAPTQRDLCTALSAVLSGKPVPTPRTKAVGCVIPELE
jgi:hypothetical protein